MTFMDRLKRLFWGHLPTRLPPKFDLMVVRFDGTPYIAINPCERCGVLVWDVPPGSRWYQY
jgi:hypothetical protein